MFDVSNEQKT
ncbi:unnamed protein product, partial [Rotaria socialis]